MRTHEQECSYLIFQTFDLIFNRTCNVNMGDLLAKHGGGGHRGAGTAQLPADKADAGMADILATLKANAAS